VGSGPLPNVLGSRFVVQGLLPLGPGAGDEPPRYVLARCALHVFFNRTPLASSPTPAVGIGACPEQSEGTMPAAAVMQQSL